VYDLIDSYNYLSIGPCLYHICIRPSHSVATKCHHKYADDTTLLVAQHSSIDIDQEYNNVNSNKLSINTDKTKEIIFHLAAARNLIIPPHLPGIERVKQTTLLGIDVTDTLSTAAYVNGLCLMQVNQSVSPMPSSIIRPTTLFVASRNLLL